MLGAVELLDEVEDAEVAWNAAEVGGDEVEDSAIAVLTDEESITETVEDAAEEGEPEVVEVVDVGQFPGEQEIVVKFLTD